jgi:hypothetical protein
MKLEGGRAPDPPTSSPLHVRRPVPKPSEAYRRPHADRPIDAFHVCFPAAIAHGYRKHTSFFSLFEQARSAMFPAYVPNTQRFTSQAASRRAPDDDRSRLTRHRLARSIRRKGGASTLVRTCSTSRALSSIGSNVKARSMRGLTIRRRLDCRGHPPGAPTATS